MRRSVSVLLLLLLLLACSSPTDPQQVRVLGAIAGYNEGDPFVDVPAVAERGVPFAVAVRTYGGGCHTAADTEVRVRGLTAEVTPYDRTSVGGVCTDILRAFTHTATVRFDAAGPARVRVRGRQMAGGADLVVDRDVLVR